MALGLLLLGIAGWLAWSGITGERPLEGLSEILAGRAPNTRPQMVDAGGVATVPTAGPNTGSASALGDAVNPASSPYAGYRPAAVTSGFGPRSSPGGIGSTNHKGIDFGVPGGNPVVAAGAGVVVAAGMSGGYGNRVDINHGNGWGTRYAHMQRVSVAKGQSVQAGTVLGLCGQTGTATGNHLHFETRRAS